MRSRHLVMPLMIGALIWALASLVVAADSPQPSNLPAGNHWDKRFGLRGMSGDVHALALDGTGQLYAGGFFQVAGDSVANNIARWDGNAWFPLGSGVSNEFLSAAIRAVAPAGDGTLYAAVCGGFKQETYGWIYRWDGTTWAGIGSMLDPSYVDINALAFDSRGYLYVGGHFESVGGQPVANIARWDGSAWSALGSGIGGPVEALAVDSSGQLYAATNSSVELWDGRTWTRIGEFAGVYWRGVKSLTFDDQGLLYAAGGFAYANGIPATNVARWDGETWAALGSAGQRHRRRGEPGSCPGRGYRRESVRQRLVLY